MKKILQITLMCMSMFATAYAQVIFHDLNPDVVLNQVTPGDVSYFVDMQNDGDSDFQIINSYVVINDSTFSKSMMLPDSGNAVATDAQKNPLALTSGSLIDGTLNWQTDNLGSLMEIKSYFGVNISYQGNWIDATDRFLGVRFMDNDTLKYGWIEMMMSTNQVTVVTNILDYAYESSGAGITTQDSLGAIGVFNAQQKNNFEIFTSNNTAIVKYTGSLTDPIHICITDELGYTIKEINTRERELHINLSSFAGKFYLISAQEENEIVRKKIIVM